MEISFDERSSITLPDGWEPALSKVIQLGLAHAQGPADCEVSLSFVSIDEMRALNLQYLHNDRETDVLSFSFNESGPAPLLLGDIVICTEVAAEQAKDYGHAYMRELAFLTCHGLLHLLGYDHTDPEDEKIMIQAQDAILHAAGIGRDA
jgi:probable rRNA maturation factor